MTFAAMAIGIDCLAYTRNHHISHRVQESHGFG